MLDKNFIKDQMKDIYNASFELTVLRGNEKFTDFFYDKFKKVIEDVKQGNTELSITKMENNLKNNIDSQKYLFLKSETQGDTKLIYFREIMFRGTSVPRGIIVIKLEENKFTMYLYQNSPFLGKIKPEKLFEYLSSVLTYDKRKIKEIEDFGFTNKGEKVIEESKRLNDSTINFPLDKHVYLPDIYIHPITVNKLEIIKARSNYEYEQTRRAVINDNKMLNKINQYNINVIGTNPYHEMEFPVIGLKPNLEEFTDLHVWDDEKIFYKGGVYEYLPQGIPDHYVSISGDIGGITVGNISKISGKDYVGWNAISRGEFYITERQLIIFDKGSEGAVFKIINAVLDSDNFKRGVYCTAIKNIESIEGDSSEGTLTIKKKNNGIFKLAKLGGNGKAMAFNEDELRYLVNLIGSIIEKTFY